MNTSSYIYSFLPILPRFKLPQNKIVDWTVSSHLRVESFKGESPDLEKFEHTLRRFSLSDKYIHTRSFDCDDVNDNWSEHEIYKLMPESPYGVTIEERNVFFSKRVTQVMSEMYQSHSPSHLVHVSCTGYVSPSPAQVLFHESKSPPNITHAYHMGCYASLPAIRMAQGLALLEEAEVDVVHTEMCSLHLNPALHTPEQMVVQTLFADGYIKYSISAEKKGMKILAVSEKLIPDSLDDMTWIPGPYGMKMTLSREVPFKIRDSLPQFVQDLCEKAGLNASEVLKNGIFAIHPGGPKIIEAVQKKLELRDDQVTECKNVLTHRGNMSSATLPHVWNEILLTKPKAGTIVLSLAFGPGLTMFGSVFEVA